MLLGFVAMFGIGGLLGVHGFGLGAGAATLVGVVAGLLGAGVVFGAFKALRQAESTDAFSLEDMVGSTGRVSVARSEERRVGKECGSRWATYRGEKSATS